MHLKPALLAVATLAASPLLAQQAPQAPASAAEGASIGVPKGHRLVWSDDFEGRGLPDAAKWSYDTAFNKSGWHNREKQYYSAAWGKNARLRNGRLIIEAHREQLDPKLFPDWAGSSTVPPVSSHAARRAGLTAISKRVPNSPALSAHGGRSGRLRTSRT